MNKLSGKYKNITERFHPLHIIIGLKKRILAFSLHLSLINCQLTGYGGVYHAPPGVEYWDRDTIDASIRASKIGRMIIGKIKKKASVAGLRNPVKEIRIFPEHFKQKFGTELNQFPMQEKTIPQFQGPNSVNGIQQNAGKFSNFGQNFFYPSLDQRYPSFQETEVLNTKPVPIFNQCFTCELSDNRNIFHTHHTHTIRHGHGVVSNVEIYRQFIQ